VRALKNIRVTTLFNVVFFFFFLKKNIYIMTIIHILMVNIVIHTI